MSNNRFNGKVAVVVGGTSGIGLEIVNGLIDERRVCSCRSQKKKSS